LADGVLHGGLDEAGIRQAIKAKQASCSPTRTAWQRTACRVRPDRVAAILTRGRALVVHASAAAAIVTNCAAFTMPFRRAGDR
jgi:hypothetical protein